MMYFLYGLLVIAVIVVVCYVTFKAMDAIDGYSSPFWLIGALCTWAALIGGLIYGVQQEDNKGPCLRYETSMYYNAGTKTMMPARRCAERAEWVQ